MQSQAFCPHLQVPRAQLLPSGSPYHYLYQREGRGEKAVPVGEVIRQGGGHTVYRFDSKSDVCLLVDSVKVFAGRRALGDYLFSPSSLPEDVSEKQLDDFIVDRQVANSIDVVIFEDTQEVQYLWLILPPIGECHRCRPRQIADDLYFGDCTIEGFELLKLV